MVSYIPREGDPYKKRLQFDQREYELMEALRKDVSQKRLDKLAERLRQAKIGLLRAKQSLAVWKPETLGC